MYKQPAYLQYTPLFDGNGQLTQDRLVTLVINRPEAANAWSGELLLLLQQLLQEVAADPSARILLLQGAGKHFSAGADLQWMKASAELDFASNQAEAEKLLGMFEALVKLKIPTVAVVKGAVYGGAVGMVAACDYVLALESARFCLSEVKIGLLPAVIMPYLGRKMATGALRQLILTGKVFSAEAAFKLGLVQNILSSDTIEAALHEECSLLLAASPEAQTASKQLLQLVSTRNWQQCSETVQAIAQTRASQMGQQGLAAFFQKIDPPWLRRLPGEGQLFLT